MSDISATLARIHTKYYFCRDNVCRRAPSPCGAHRPLGAGGAGVKNSKNWGVVSFVYRTATISIFLSDAKCSPICRARPAHILVWNRRDRPRRFYRVGQKVRKNLEFFTISRLYVHISHKLLKIEAYKQRTKKSFISPPSNCRICMDPSLTGFYVVSQKVSDIIPVSRLTPIATQPSAVSVLLSVAKCGRVL